MQYFPTQYREFIYTRTYSRFLPEKNRRESWGETVQRYSDFFTNKIPEEHLPSWLEATDAILNFEVMPSMRALWTAGEALERENSAGYNCSYLQISRIEAFSEMLYLLMNGAGVGFSVERQYIVNLPVIPDKLEKSEEVITVADSKKGWAVAFNELIKCLYEGTIPQVNYDLIRPEGAPLRTFGGRSSGREPLRALFKFTVDTFGNAVGRKLTSLEAHDICCYICQCVVVGGVRRSSSISLSNRSDDRMAHAKDGAYWDNAPYRSNANNSIAYTEKPTSEQFLEDWLDLKRSGTGERGIFNRESAEFIVGRTGRRKVVSDLGTNPCSEIILRDQEMCNLSEVVVRNGDTLKELKEKVRKATILGCLQSTLTDFNFISKKWSENMEEERLLGVSLTGIRDHKVLGKVSDEAKVWLTDMKNTAIQTAKEWSDILGINMPAAITAVKPSGTVSQLVDSASGLHTRPYKYYIRRVRISTLDPLFKMLKDKGFDWSPENDQLEENCNTAVLSFPIKAPNGAITDSDVTALDQLEYWLMLQQYWCEHKPSVTISVADKEWIQVANWLYEHWRWVSGLSFIPKGNVIYRQAPQEEIDEKTYLEMVEKLPSIDFSELPKWEVEDATEGSQILACVGGACELV